MTALIAMTVSSPVLATTSFGSMDCGQWVKNQSNNSPNIQSKAWLLGYLSGLNAVEFSENALDKINSTEQIFLWMDNYCKKNPLERVPKGAQQLMIELIKK
jgi:hypothetical protein